MSQRDRHALSQRKWHLWLAGLAGMPYIAQNISAPAIPGQCNVFALCIVAACVVLWDRCEAHSTAKGTARLKRARRIVVLLGFYVMFVLAAAETIAIVRGRGPLESTFAIKANSSLSLVEFSCFILATVGWALSSPAKDSGAPSSSRPLLFCIGIGWPAASVLLSKVMGVFSALESLILCGTFGMVAALTSQWAASDWRPSPPQAMLLLCGQLTFLALKSFVLGDVYYCFCSYIPSAEWLLPLSLLVLAALPYLAFRARRKGELEMGSATTDDFDKARATLRTIDNDGALTNREFEVLAHTLTDEPARMIAGRLGIATSTVATFRKRGYEKLGVDGKREFQSLAGAQGERHPSPAEKTDEASREDFPTSTLRRIIWVLALLSVILLRPPVDLEIWGTTVIDMPRYLAWMAGLVLVVISVVRLASGCTLGTRPPRNANPPHDASLPFASAVLPLCALSLPITVYLSWIQSPEYLFWTVPCLCLCLTALGMEIVRPARDSPLTTHAAKVLCAGMDAFLVRGVDGVLLVGLGFIFSVQIGNMPPSDIPLCGCLASIVISLVCTIELVFAARVPRHPPHGQIERALKYLEGRGLGELQANVALGIALGQSTREICSTCQTTTATVKSYRLRTYQMLGVHNVRELRELLQHDAGLTG